MKVTPLFLLFLVFLVLKLMGYITWSWWWVTAPLWGGLVAVLAIWLGVWLFAVAMVLVGAMLKNGR